MNSRYGYENYVFFSGKKTLSSSKHKIFHKDFQIFLHLLTDGKLTFKNKSQNKLFPLNFQFQIEQSVVKLYVYRV